jgi:hypothetical protein
MSLQEPQRPEYIAEIAKLIVRLDVIKRLRHTLNHWDTEVTGQLLQLLNINCDQTIWEHFTPRELTILRQQLRKIGETLETVEQAIASQQLSPQTEKALKRVKTSVQTLKRIVDLGRPSCQTGSIYHYTSWKEDKLGNQVCHPKVQGERDPYNPNHWYWGLSYVVWDGSKWRDRSESIPRKALPQVREMVDNCAPVQETLNYIDSARKTKG